MLVPLLKTGFIPAGDRGFKHTVVGLGAVELAHEFKDRLGDNVVRHVALSLDEKTSPCASLGRISEVSSPNWYAYVETRPFRLHTRMANQARGPRPRRGARRSRPL